MFTAALASSRKRIRSRLVISPTKNLELLSVDRNSEATYVDASGIIQTAQPNELRVDYSTGAAKILSEGQATNLIEYSEDFSQSYWAINGGNFSSNSLAAPDGNMTSWTWSEFTPQLAIYDEDNGVFISENDVYTVYENWVKISRTFISSSGLIRVYPCRGGGIYFFQRPSASVVENNSYTFSFFVMKNADNTNLHFWGAELKKDNSSYIPTAGTSVTRLADTITTTPPSWTKRIIETVDGEVNVINTIPAIYQLPKGNIDQIEFR